MRILIDTNVLLRASQPSHAMHDVAVAALDVLAREGDTLVVAIQNLAEYWNVLTRPEGHNGMGFTVREAQAELARIESWFEVVCESPASWEIWKSLVNRYQVRGVQVHDARLVAVMQRELIRQIVTFNTADFQRFPEIETVHPQSLALRAG